MTLLKLTKICHAAVREHKYLIEGVSTTSFYFLDIEQQEKFKKEIKDHMLKSKAEAFYWLSCNDSRTRLIGGIIHSLYRDLTEIKFPAA